MSEALWIAIGVLLTIFAQQVVGTFIDTRPWPVERAAKLRNAKQLKRSRLELTKRLTGRTVQR